jgi:hypothetical protein
MRCTSNAAMQFLEPRLITLGEICDLDHSSVGAATFLDRCDFLLYTFLFSLQFKSDFHFQSQFFFQISVLVFVLCFDQFAGCACQFLQVVYIAGLFSFLRFGSCFLLVLFALFSIISITVMF